MALTRAQTRVALANALRAGCSAAQVVRAYHGPLTPDQFPLIYVTSAGSDDTGDADGTLTFGGGEQPLHRFDVLTLILLASSDNSFTEEDAENVLDLLYEQIKAVVLAHPGLTNNWAALQFSGPSEAGVFADEAGVTWLYERIPVAVVAAS